MAKHRGTSLVETLIALGIVGVALAMGVEVLTGVLRAWGRAQERAQAARMAANVLEAWRGKPWEEWRVGEHPVPKEELAGLPQAEGRVHIEPDSAFPALRRITVHLEWTSSGGEHREFSLSTLRAGPSNRQRSPG